MARGQTGTLDYRALVRELHEKGPGVLYLLWGAEDYLRSSFLQELRSVCLKEGLEEFDLRQLDGRQLDMEKFSEALDMLPFSDGRCLVDVRDFDPGQCRAETARRLTELLSDIPPWCTVALSLPAGTSPDGRLSLVKFLKKQGHTVEFTAQPQDKLLPWVARRFSEQGKRIGRAEAERLIFLSGDLMNRLIPEIEKVAAYASGETVTMEDVEAVAHRLPEANVFEMCDSLSRGDVETAARLLAELLSTKESPVAILAVLGGQMRRLYTARLALDEGLGTDFVREICALRLDFVVRKLMDGARRFTLEQLADAVTLCAETDYRMKSSSLDDGELLKELLLRLAAERGRI